MNEEDLFKSLELQMADFEFTDAEDFSKMSNRDLILRLEEIDGELYQLGELMHPKTQAGRDWHSMRAAVVVALHQRRLM
jgi:hypothetical protein